MKYWKIGQFVWHNSHYIDINKQMGHLLTLSLMFNIVPSNITNLIQIFSLTLFRPFTICWALAHPTSLPTLLKSARRTFSRKWMKTTMASWHKTSSWRAAYRMRNFRKCWRHKYWCTLPFKQFKRKRALRSKIQALWTP